MHSRGPSDDGGDRGITFPMFLTMMGEHLYDFDAETELLAAFECFDEAIKHNADDPDIYYHRGQVLFIMNEFAQAAENYTKSTELDEGFVFSHIQLAVAQYKSGNLANGMATFRRTLKAFPERSEPQNY